MLVWHQLSVAALRAARQIASGAENASALTLAMSGPKITTLQSGYLIQSDILMSIQAAAWPYQPRLNASTISQAAAMSVE